MEQPKVSVIIPVYNTEKYLPECLDSVVNQSLQDLEIICVDDGSTDGSLDVLRDYEAQDKRVRVIVQEKSNAGVARNHGLSCATGEYLSFLDSDDFFSPTMLERMFARAKDNHADIAVCRFKNYYEVSKKTCRVDWSVNTALLPRKTAFTFDEIQKDAFRSIFGYAWDKLIRRSLVVERHLRFQSQSVYEDALFVYSALLSAQSITVLPECHIYHRLRCAQDSVTDKRFSYTDYAYAFLRGLKEYLVANDIYDRYEQDFINYVIHMLYIDLTVKNRDSYSKNVMGGNIVAWLNEFRVNDHDVGYYYDLLQYQDLIRNTLNRNHSNPTTQKSHQGLLAEGKKTVPIVYATDREYMKYVLVSMVSALQYARSDTYYCFYVLVPSNNEIDAIEIGERLNRFDNYSLSFIQMGDEFSKVKLYIDHITTPTFFRLRIPGLLRDFDKCIYLDADTIVCEDLQCLLAIDLKDNYLAGVPAFAYYKNENEHRERLHLGGDVPFQYINAGVLVMNLKKMREDDKEGQFLRLLENNFESQDQDILNVACQGKIQILPYRYNVMTKYANWRMTSFPPFVRPYDIIKGKEHPVIIHYSDRIKPWNAPSSPYSSNWYAVAMSDICRDYFSDNVIFKKMFGVGALRSFFRQCIMPQLPSKFFSCIDYIQKNGLRSFIRRILFRVGLLK